MKNSVEEIFHYILGQHIPQFRSTICSNISIKSSLSIYTIGKIYGIRKDTESCITTVICRCCDPLSQWQRRFQWKLCSHWLKVLRQHQIAMATWYSHTVETHYNTITSLFMLFVSLQWCHNERHGVSNHGRIHYLLNRFFGFRSKKTPKRCVTGLCGGNSPMTGEFPAQRASNAENASIWWRHHTCSTFYKL